MGDNRLKKGINDLSTVNPQLAAEWHPFKNGDLAPSDVTCGSVKKIWWLCPQGHTYQSRILDRTRNHGCPYCSGRLPVTGVNDLAFLHPKLAQEWHTTKNSPLTPNMVTSKSGRKVWWMCEKGHEWQAQIASRSNGASCPYCSGRYPVIGETDLLSQNPKLALEWHPFKNGDLTPKMVTKASNKTVWWMCSRCGHEWQATIMRRHNQPHCPHCSSANTSFAEQSVFFYVKQYFHDATSRYRSLGYELDIYIPSINTGIEYDGWFFHKDKLSSDTEKDYLASNFGIRLIRIRENHLPATPVAINLFREDSSNNSLNICISKLLLELGIVNHSTINVANDLPLIFDQYYESVKDHSLAVTHPHLVNEWHFTKNGKLSPHTVTHGSAKKVWWICPKNHDFQARISDRAINNSTCPFCAGKKLLSGFNDLQTKYPKIAEFWDYDRNSFPPNKITAHTTRKVWWKCPSCNTSYYASVSHRVDGHGCPNCWKTKNKDY